VKIQESEFPAMNPQSLTIETEIRENRAKLPNFIYYWEEFMGTDWYPNSRDEQLHMIKTWNTIFATQ
jgi:hypothetical protein